MAYYVSQTVSRSPLKTSELSSERTADRPLGGITLLFCRRLIESAFHDATVIDRSTGKPSVLALESYEWIMADLDWTTTNGRIPPPELRAEFHGSFSWACRWMGERPEYVREHGLSKPPGVFGSGKVSVRDYVQGLPDVRRRWALAKEKYDAKISAGWDPAVEKERLRAKRIADQKRHRERSLARKASGTSIPAPPVHAQGTSDAHGRQDVPGAVLCDSSFVPRGINEAQCVGAD